MNISVPDALHAHLDHLRDRVNASRVCAQALEKELDMLERGSALGALADPDIAKLLQRLACALEPDVPRADRRITKQVGITLARPNRRV